MSVIDEYVNLLFEDSFDTSSMDYDQLKAYRTLLKINVKSYLIYLRRLLKNKKNVKRI